MVLGAWLGLALLSAGGAGGGGGAGPEIEFSGRLIDVDFDTPHCGQMQFWSPSVYDRVEGGGLSGRVVVIHACVELPRRQFAPGAGNLERFVIGQRHRLRVVRADPARLGGLMTGAIDPGDRPVFQAVRTDWAVEEALSPDAVGGLRLDRIDAFPARLQAAVRAVGQSVGAPGEFYVQIELDPKTGELIFHLWHQDAFLPQHRGMVGNPGGKCRDTYYNRKQAKVTRTYFWQ